MDLPGTKKELLKYMDNSKEKVKKFQGLKSIKNPFALMLSHRPPFRIECDLISLRPV